MIDVGNPDVLRITFHVCNPKLGKREVLAKEQNNIQFQVQSKIESL